MKTVYDWKFFCTESNNCQVIIFDNEIGEDVFKGTLNDVPSQYNTYYVQSFDPVSEDEPFLCLNIGLE